MAEGGIDFGPSVKESDYLHEFPCSLCERSGINVEGIKHCVDCDENLCPKCLSSHDAFPLTRLHIVLDTVQTRQAQSKQPASQRCSKHGGLIIDVFCPKHDFVGCSVCISSNHSSCAGKKFISDVAAGIKTSEELKQLEAEMKTLESKLDYLKYMKSDNLQRLKEDKDALKKEIKTIRKKMNEQLDRMEKELEDDVDAQFKKKIDAKRASITEVDDMLAKVKHGLNQVKNNNDNEADIFVSYKVVKEEMTSDIYPAHSRVDERLPERSFELYIDENSNLIMEGKTIMAAIKEKYIVQAVEYNEDINISVSDDKYQCMVYGMCALPDGCLVLADFTNKKLKKLDLATNTVSTLINLPDNPVDVCLVDNTRLAVSLQNLKQIQFVSLAGQVTLDNSFPVGDRCRGLAHCDGLLYVCCGGWRSPAKIEGRGHVDVYDCNGKLLRRLYEEIRVPKYISVIKEGYNTTMYISDLYKGVQARGIDGTVKHRFNTDSALDTFIQFCLIGTDQLCIVYKRILLDEKDVQGDPCCLYYDDRSSQLFVALDECDVIKVFQLKM